MKTFQFCEMWLGFLLISCSVSYLSAFNNDIINFRSTILPLCFNTTTGESGVSGGNLLINGQVNPLSPTFENFLYLVEKLENANPRLHLREILYILLHNYTYENIIVKNGRFTFDELPDSDFFLISDKWKAQLEQLSYENPLTADETCSLFFMLSHTVDDSPAWFEDANAMYIPIGKDGIARADGKVTKHPREKGIVLFRSSGDVIALSRVILGLHLGLAAEEIDLQSIIDKKTPKKTIPDMNRKFKPLYAFTLADVLVYNSWLSNEKRMAENGRFISVFNDIQNELPKEICPTIYQLPENQSSLYTYSLFRGGVDGLILGNIAKTLESLSTEIKLSQILRSYYTRRGIEISKGTSNGGNGHLYFTPCTRNTVLETMKEELNEQIHVLTDVLARDQADVEDVLGKIQQHLDDYQNRILQINKAAFCEAPGQNDPLPCETPVELIVVLDTKANQLNIQKEIVGLLANQLDLSPEGSSITVLLDQLNGTSEFNLDAVITRSGSTAEVACHLLQENIEMKGADRVRVIQGVDRYLMDRKHEDSDLNATPGKVLLYFNFEESEVTSNELKKVLSQFYQRHNDIHILAVGKDVEVLKKYVGSNNHDSLLLIDLDSDRLSKELFSKICSEPAAMQYTDCVKARNEKAATFEGFVTRGSVQRWAMDAKYFKKSFTAKILFDTDNNNNVKVCHNRATPEPELEGSNCDNSTSAKRRLQFDVSNPCSGMSASGCSPAFFSVIGGNYEKDEFELCKHNKCKSLHQVKFRVSHEGIRCSGCSTIFSSSVLVFISTLFIYLTMNK